MTNQANKKTTKTIEVNAEDTAPVTTTVTSPIGHFIVVNTKNIQGIRINLDKIRTYAKNNENTIGLGWDNGTQTSLQYTSEKDADAMMGVLDSYCL